MLLLRRAPHSCLCAAAAASTRAARRQLCARAAAMPSAAAAGAPQSGLSLLPSDYPEVARGSTVDELHGVAVPDPYRWLEDPDAPETQAFVEAQNKVTAKVLAQCDTRDKFKELFTAVYDYEKFDTPFKRGPRYYYYHNTGLQQHYVLLGQDSLQGEPVVLLDPNGLSEDGTVALKDAVFSDDGALLAYSLSSGGSDWATIRVLEVGADGRGVERGDLLEHVKFSSIAWTHDGQGFFYNRYPEPSKCAGPLGTETDSNTDQQLVYHRLGSPQAEDVVVHADPDHPTWMFSAEVTDDGRYVLVYTSEGCAPQNRLYVLDLASVPRRADDGALDFSSFDRFKGSAPLPLVKLVDSFDASWDYVANEGEAFTFKTNLDAPRYRVVRVDLSAPGPSPSAWREVVPQHPRDLLQSAVALAGDELVLRHLRDVKSALALHRLSTGERVREFELPGIGSVSGFSGNRKSSEFFFSFTSFVQPGATFRVDLAAGDAPPALFRATALKVPHAPEEYEVKQVFVTSKDGTQVPMFITHRRGLVLDGSNPTLLYGYGGFNISLEPGFSPSRLAWMAGYGGVFAQANLRGGGEYGVEWRDAGSKANKQNVFDDFQACAEYLQAAGYCRADKLAIQGGSNGGLLVAACVNQRPDLYACGIAQVGVLDMFRFHKFTIGAAWCTDYGSPDERAAFEVLRRYSPLHNVSPPAGGAGQYPAVILATGDHDDRVVPLHSLKFVAELQHALVAARGADAAQRNPLLLRCETKSGHGAGRPTTKIIAETADLIGFAAAALRASWVAGAKLATTASSPPRAAAAPWQQRRRAAVACRAQAQGGRPRVAAAQQRAEGAPASSVSRRAALLAGGGGAALLAQRARAARAGVAAKAPAGLVPLADLPMRRIRLPRGGVGRDYVVVQLTVAGQGPFDFMVDSGLTAEIITPALRQQLGIGGSRGKVAGLGAGGASASELPLPPLNTVVLDFPQAHLDAAHECQGMLGQEVLQLFDTDLDFAASRVRLWPAGSFGALAGAAGMVAVPAAVLNETGVLGIRATSPAAAAAQPFVGIVDSGASFSAVNWAAARLLGLAGPDGELRGKRGPDILSLGVDGAPMPYPTTAVQFTFAGDASKDTAGRLVFAPPPSGWRPWAPVTAAVGDLPVFSQLLGDGRTPFTGPAALIGLDVWGQRRLVIGAGTQAGRQRRLFVGAK
ncbi:Prep [Scenedesmus sp. PABB004]|nr:Prep [Scenedesmus sp. PABB004]